MAKKANGFMIFNDTMRAISPLPPEEFKSLVLAMFQYFLGEEPTPLIGAATYFWPIVTQQIDRLKTSYKRRCKANAANAKKRKNFSLHLDYTSFVCYNQCVKQTKKCKKQT